MKRLKSVFLLFLTFIFFNAAFIPDQNIAWQCYALNELNETRNEELYLTKFLKDLSLSGIETKRLEVNAIKEEDYDILANYLMDPDVTKYLLTSKTLRFYKVNDARLFIERLDKAYIVTFILRLKDTKVPIGMLGFTFMPTAAGKVINISYWLGKEYQKKGYAKEAIPKIVAEVFDNIKNLKLYIDFRKPNIASKRIADHIADYIRGSTDLHHTQPNGKSSKLKLEKFNCFSLDIEEYVFSKN